MSHKTGDASAAVEARYIANKHQVQVYMAEWDDTIDDDSDELPEYIMSTIRKSKGFLVNVIGEIVVSMWVGYEIGGAHAMSKPRAKILYNSVNNCPTVVSSLPSIRTRNELDRWIYENILR